MLDLLGGVDVGELGGVLQGAARVVDVSGVRVQAGAHYGASLHDNFVAVSGSADHTAEHLTRQHGA
ncbi:hypothetical protein EGM85_11850 [Macrococcus caseolyticus]|nr:hypothetical protein [Macrococcus caseolyticus]RKO10420.1 hypothetical protein D6861_11850 [Macrococcus caseolyticus]